MKPIRFSLSALIVVLAANAIAKVPMPEDKNVYSSTKPYIKILTKQFTLAEDINILKNMFNEQIALVNSQLDLASTLEYKQYEKGDEINANDCQKYEALVSKNYPLHFYKEDFFTEHKGVNVCYPSAGGWPGQPVYSSIKYSFLSQQISNAFNIKGAYVLTVEYDNYNYYWHGYKRHAIKQFLLDENYKVIEITELNVLMADKRNNESTISTVDINGNVLTRSVETEGSIINSSNNFISYLSADGALASGDRNLTQLDGKKIKTSFTYMPYNWQWDAYEISPYGNINNYNYHYGDKVNMFYLSNNKTVNQPSSHIAYITADQEDKFCQYGYVGTREDYVLKLDKEFGDRTCPQAFFQEERK